MLTEVPSLKYFASALNGWASQQDKQITTGQMVLLVFFLTFSDFRCLATVVKVTSASCCLKPLWWCFPANPEYHCCIERHASSSVHSSVCHNILYTALTVNLCMQVNIKRVVDVPFAHGTADLVRGHPALVKPGREEVIAEYAGQQHLHLHDVQSQGETADEQPLDDPWFGQVS